MRQCVKFTFLMGIIPGLFSLSPTLASADGGFNMKEPQGFHWYTAIPEKQEEQEASTNSTISPQTPPQDPYEKQMEKFKKDMERAQNRAILNPTYENVRVLKEYQDHAMNQSTDFAKMWMVVNFMEGGLRPEDNADNQFRKIYSKQESQDLDLKISEIAQTHGLFFFFKQDCPYCHQFAPLLKRFAQKYGFEVKAISKAGGKLPSFPKSVQDNGMGATLNPNGAYPSLFLANPHTGEVIPVAEGMTSLEQLKQNFKHIFYVLERGV